MLSTLLHVLIAASTPQPAQLELTSGDRYGLVIGLERRLGGKFVLTGLADAEGTCRVTRSCVTGAQLAATSQARSVDELIATASIDGDKPKAIVSLRSGRRLYPFRLELQMSVYDPVSGAWRTEYAAMRREGERYRVVNVSEYPADS